MSSIMCLKTYLWIVSIVALITSSLLGVFLTPLPDFMRGYILGLLTATYLWLFVFVRLFHKSTCYSFPDKPESSDELDQIIGRLVKEEIN